MARPHDRRRGDVKHLTGGLTSEWGKAGRTSSRMTCSASGKPKRCRPGLPQSAVRLSVSHFDRLSKPLARLGLGDRVASDLGRPALAEIGSQNQLDHLGEELLDAVDLTDDEPLVGRPEDRAGEGLLKGRRELVSVGVELAPSAQERKEGTAGLNVVGEENWPCCRGLDDAGASDNRIGGDQLGDGPQSGGNLVGPGQFGLGIEGFADSAIGQLDGVIKELEERRPPC